MSKAAVSTAKKPRGRPFKAGNNANPAGRPKGSRNKLSEAFISALFNDFERHGIKAIQDMREEKPGDYVKTVAALVPSQFQVVDKDGEATNLNATVVFVRADG